MLSPNEVLAYGLTLGLPLPGTEESWLLVTMGPQQAFHTAALSASWRMPLVVLLRYMLRQMPSRMRQDMESQQMELTCTQVICLAWAVHNSSLMLAYLESPFSTTTGSKMA